MKIQMIDSGSANYGEYHITSRACGCGWDARKRGQYVCWLGPFPSLAAAQAAVDKAELAPHCQGIS
jgi:hypothetical protein